MSDKFTGDGFSSTPFSEKELREMRERARHYDDHVAPYVQTIALIAMFKGRWFWVAGGFGGAVTYLYKNGVLL